MNKFTLAMAALIGAAMASGAQARDQIEVVGSSTVFPFATSVAEQFGRTSKFKTPVIEATGSGGGLKLFCAGIGLEHPDVTNASRRIKEREFQKCQANGIDLTEIVIGFDGIVVATTMPSKPMTISVKSMPLSKALSRVLRILPRANTAFPARFISTSSTLMSAPCPAFLNMSLNLPAKKPLVRTAICSIRA